MAKKGATEAGFNPGSTAFPESLLRWKFIHANNTTGKIRATSFESKANMKERLETILDKNVFPFMNKIKAMSRKRHASRSARPEI